MKRNHDSTYESVTITEHSPVSRGISSQKSERGLRSRFKERNPKRRLIENPEIVLR